jgi:hypothetical protein
MKQCWEILAENYAVRKTDHTFLIYFSFLFVCLLTPKKLYFEKLYHFFFCVCYTEVPFRSWPLHWAQHVIKSRRKVNIIIINRTDGHSVIGERKWQTYNAYSHNMGHSKHIWFIINIPLPSSESDSSLGILSKSAKNKMYLKG